MQTPVRKDAFAPPPSNLGSATNRAPNPRRIGLILVDGDEAYREAAAGGLDCLGFNVAAYPSGEALLADGPAVHLADVIAVDWKLPSGLGTDLIRQLHERGVRLPVVILSGLAAPTYEAKALDRGALDFVDKARGLSILAKRLRIVVGWSERESSHRLHPRLRCGALDLHPEFMRATWRGVDLDLTLTEFNVVYLFASQPEEYITYRAIYDCVHHIGFSAGNGEHGFRSNVRSAIKRIRNKFRSIDAGFNEIENFAAVGYRWRSDPARLGPDREPD
jgi:two-component system response regulator ChvI